MMMAASEVMRELVHEQDGQQCQREWQAGGESSWLVIEQSEVVEEFFKREGFAMGISDGKLRAGHQTRAQSGEE